MSIGYIESGESRSAQAAAYGGLVDAVGGVAAGVLAIVGLTGVDSVTMTSIATIVFGAALLLQAGAILSEYAHLAGPPTAVSTGSRLFESSGGLSMMFLAGAVGIVLGILALLGIASDALTSVSVIVFASALVLGSNAVRQLHILQSSAAIRSTVTASEMLADEMASGSAGIQLLAGLAGLVLGILAVCGTSTVALTLVALLVMGATLVLTGSTLSGLVLSFMRAPHTATSPRV